MSRPKKTCVFNLRAHLYNSLHLLFDDFLSRMDAQWIGKGVDLKCGGLGVFQGVIDGVHLEEQTITIKNVIHNGVPSKMSSVTIE